MSQDRAYLDNAATSWPKPESVYRAIDHFAREVGTATRGSHQAAIHAAQTMDQARAKLRSLFGARHDDSVIFCFNGTDALNLCIHGCMREGDHAITTDTDHNSVLRPLRDVCGDKLSIASCSSTGRVSPDDIRSLLQGSTRLVAISHASNVTGTIQDVRDIGRCAREAGALFLIDASQTAGEIPLDLYADHADMIATSGHKGLMGPLGTGVAVIRRTALDQIQSVRQGGTGSESESELQPDHPILKYESGSPNLLGIAGLLAGLDYLAEHTDAGSQRLRLANQLIYGLHDIPGVLVYAANESRCAVVSFQMESLSCHDVAAILEADANIQVRAGLHCAPRIHKAIGSDCAGGTVRASLGVFNTSSHVDRLLRALESISQLAR